jgi:hypothetical protein
MSWPGDLKAKRGSYHIDQLPEPQIKKRRAPDATIPKSYSNAYETQKLEILLGGRGES